MLEGTTYLEILREIVLPIETEHAFTLHAIVVIGLQGDADASTCINDTLIENGDLASRVIDGIIAALGKFTPPAVTTTEPCGT